jgi:hypothetical protein
MGDNGQLHSDTGWEDLMFFETAGSSLYGTAPPALAIPTPRNCSWGPSNTILLL